MTTTSFHRILVPLLLVAVLGTTRPADAESIVVSFVPSAATVDLGEQFTVDVIATIPAGSNLVSWGMDAVYDDMALGHDPAADVAIGAAFTSAFGPVGDGDGLLGVTLAPDPPADGGSFVLATLTFTAHELGMTEIGGTFDMDDPFEGFFGVGGGPLPADFGSAMVAVVPLPPAVLAGGLGLAIAFMLRRKFVRAA